MSARFFDIAVFIVFVILAICVILAFIRVARGPSLPDRVVALDLITVLTVAFIAVYAAYSRTIIFIDAAIAISLIAFLSTLAFARFFEKGGGVDD